MIKKIINLFFGIGNFFIVWTNANAVTLLTNQFITPERIANETNPKLKFVGVIFAPIWNFCISRRISPFWAMWVILVILFYFLDVKPILRKEKIKWGSFILMLFICVIILYASISTQINLIIKSEL